MRRKRNRELPYKIVKNLPVGKGVIVLRTKKGKTIEVAGKVKKLPNEEKHLQSKSNNKHSISLSFGPGTEVMDIKEWRPRITLEEIQNKK